MRVAIVGSRDLRIQNLEAYVPKGVTEIVSGGARGIDTCARQYALRHHIKLTEYLPRLRPVWPGSAPKAQYYDYRKRRFGDGVLGWEIPRHPVCRARVPAAGHPPTAVSGYRKARPAITYVLYRYKENTAPLFLPGRRVFPSFYPAFFFSSCNLSLIMAINSLLVGFPRVLWMVYPK